MEIEEYFSNIINYEDKTNMYHPDNIDKIEDISFIKVIYRAMYGELEWQKKNMAKNYLNKINNDKRNNR